MDTLITNQSELRHRCFQALTKALGWVNAVRFLRQYDPGSGNYTEERRTLLPDSFSSCPVSAYSTASGDAPWTQPGVLGTLPTATSGARSVSDEGAYPVSIPASSTAGSLSSTEPPRRLAREPRPPVVMHWMAWPLESS